MDLEKQPAPGQPAPEGCLTVAVRIPVRIVVLVLVVPVRMVWDALVVVGRFLRDSVLRPLWRALVVWPLTALWRYARVLTPIGRGIVWLLKGVGAVLAWIFTPVWRAIAWCAGGLVWLAGTIVNGIGVALYWIARVLLVLPAVALWRWVLAPVGR